MPPCDRRDFLIVAGAAASAYGMSRAGAWANIAPAASSRIVIADKRFAESRAFARAAASSGARIVWINGDITDFWYDELDLLWRREKVSLTGLTTHAPFFYLQQLAMDRGLRVTFRTEIFRTEPQAESRPLIAWAISPRACRRDIA